MSDRAEPIEHKSAMVLTEQEWTALRTVALDYLDHHRGCTDAYNRSCALSRAMARRVVEATDA